MKQIPHPHIVLALTASGTLTASKRDFGATVVLGSGMLQRELVASSSHVPQVGDQVCPAQGRAQSLLRMSAARARCLYCSALALVIGHLHC